jgi:hypothetical protein
MIVAALLLFDALRHTEHPSGGRNRAVIMAALLLLPLAALIADNRTRGVWDRSEWALFAVAALLLVGGILLAFIERRNGYAFRRARGLRITLVGLVLAVIVGGVPVIAAAVGLRGNDSVTDPAEAELSAYDRAVNIFDRVTQLVGEEADLDAETVALRLDEGVPVARLVRDNNGNLERVIQGISEILTGQVEILASSGDMNETAAAIAIAQMENVVRIGVEAELAGLLERFEPDDRPVDTP